MRIILLASFFLYVFAQDETTFDTSSLENFSWITKKDPKKTRRIRYIDVFNTKYSDNFPLNLFDDRKSDYQEYTEKFDRIDGAYRWDKKHDDFAEKSMELESDFGTFVPPNDRRFKHSRYHDGTRKSHVQKIEKETATKEKISNMLKNYLEKMYAKKYRHNPRYQEIDPNDIDGEKGKFLFDSFSALKNKTEKIASKFLTIFQVVQFNNTQCKATSGSSEYLGICYLKNQCDALNGTSLGDCAAGYGVCCVFRGSCGVSASQNCSYFESPDYPNYYPPGGGVVPPMPPSNNSDLRPDPRRPYSFARQVVDTLSCTFSVTKISPDIGRMRIDFIDLELLGPTNGTCINERLVISGTTINQIPTICGYNTGQHVYVDVSMLNGPLQLSVLSNMSYRKRYKIRICQISKNSCDSGSNCLQYYTGPSGVISSFNYDQALMLPRSTPQYFNNLNYAICIRREAGYCSITYSNTINNLEYPFELVNYLANGQTTVPRNQAGIEMFNCPNDYVVINGVRLCGYKFNDGTVNMDLFMNAPVTDNSNGPIVVQVRTDGMNVGRGFKLYYTQNRCPVTF